MPKPQFDLYFAGISSKKIINDIVDNNFNQLLSFINERKHADEYIKLKKEGKWQGKLMIDSGAFSVHKSGKEADVEAYIKWINENHEYIDFYIQLDDIPGKWGEPKTEEQLLTSPQKTWENYLYMRSKVADKNKLLGVFHQADNFKYLKQFLEYRDEDGSQIEYMCISSNKELSPKARTEWYKKCYEMIQNSSNPNIKTHSLGTQSETHCESYPFTSVDATSWIMTGANGNIYTKWGVLTISDRSFHKKENVIHHSHKHVIEEYINELGFDFTQLQKDSIERIRFNLLYLGNWAKNTRQYRGPKSFNMGRLF